MARQRSNHSSITQKVNISQLQGMDGRLQEEEEEEEKKEKEKEKEAEEEEEEEEDRNHRAKI